MSTSAITIVKSGHWVKRVLTRKVKHQVAIHLTQVLLLGVLVGTWQLLVSVGVLRDAFVSEPSQIVPAFMNGIEHGQLLNMMGVTLYETFVGFGVSVVGGMLVGFLMDEFRFLAAVINPFLTAFNSLPRIALAPLFVLWFGLGSLSRIVLIISLSFFIVTFNTFAGLQNVNRDHLLLARILGASRRERFLKFVLPSAAPTIFNGIQLALTYAFLGAVVGEMLSGSQGIGGYLSLQLGSFDTTDFFAALVLLVIVALIVSGLLRALERRLLKWRVIELKGARKALQE